MSKEGDKMSTIGTVLVLNGPNLNLLGRREPEVYGSLTLDQIVADLTSTASAQNVSVQHFQSNHEGELIDAIHAAQDKVDFIVINPAAFTHTSIALRDALLAVAIPFIEVHLSNPHTRENFRRHSYFSDKALAVIAGCGTDSYRYAIDAAIKYIQKP